MTLIIGLIIASMLLGAQIYRMFVVKPRVEAMRSGIKNFSGGKKADLVQCIEEIGQVLNRVW